MHAVWERGSPADDRDLQHNGPLEADLEDHAIALAQVRCNLILRDPMPALQSPDSTALNHFPLPNTSEVFADWCFDLSVEPALQSTYIREWRMLRSRDEDQRALSYEEYMCLLQEDRNRIDWFQDQDIPAFLQEFRISMWYSWRERHFPVSQLMYAESMTTTAETTINQDSNDEISPVVRRLLTDETAGEDVALEPDDNASTNSMPGRGPGRKMGDLSSEDESMSHANANFDDDSDFESNHVAFRVRVFNDLEPDDYSIDSEFSDSFFLSNNESDQSMPGFISREERD